MDWLSTKRVTGDTWAAKIDQFVGRMRLSTGTESDSLGFSSVDYRLREGVFDLMDFLERVYDLDLVAQVETCEEVNFEEMIIEMIGEKKVRSLSEFVDVLNDILETKNERNKLYTPSSLNKTVG